MAELDYAYLADYVVVQDGKLTAVGASFTFMRVPALGGELSVGIGGRIRSTVEQGTVEVNLRVTAPEDTFQIEFNGIIDAGPDARPYGDGKVGLLFALNAKLPAIAAGLYRVEVLLGGEVARELAFELEADA